VFNSEKISGSAKEELINKDQELKDLKGELNQLKNKLDFFFDDSPDIMYEIDFRGPKFIRVNDTVCKKLGYTREELLAKNPLDLMDDKSKKIFQKRINHVLSGEKPPQWIEYSGYTKDGHKLIGELYIKFTYEKGKPIGGTVIAHDITEYKKAEEYTQGLLENEKQFTEELQTSNEELQYTAAKLQTSNQELLNTTEELQISNEELKQMHDELIETVNKLEISNSELEQFAYVSSHDLQEPLRMVGSFSQLLEKRYKNRLDEDADDYIGFIVEGANRMKDLIDDLLVFSQLNTDAKEFKLTDLVNILDDVLSNMKASIEENNAIITYEQLPIISVDHVQIRRLFQNLISNAIKFNHNKPAEIHIFAKESEYEWLFGVSDNGIGIDTEHQKQIFKIFNRLHTREKYPGTGIGLAISKRIVKRHGGRIWVESEPGEGATFYFTIPKKETDINPKIP
jgi:PAS domain S-box-containing protein